MFYYVLCHQCVRHGFVLLFAIFELCVASSGVGTAENNLQQTNKGHSARLAMCDIWPLLLLGITVRSENKCRHTDGLLALTVKRQGGQAIKPGLTLTLCTNKILTKSYTQKVITVQPLYFSPLA